MKCFLSMMLIAQTSISYTLPLDFIMSEMGKFSLLKTEAHFQMATKKDEVVHFTDLHLSNGVFKEVDANHPLNLILQDALALKKYLNQIDIDTSIISQALFFNEPVFVVGARPNDPLSPQIWIDKARFVPVKLVSKDKAITFEKWMSLALNPKKKFPRIINIATKNGVETFSISEKI